MENRRGDETLTDVPTFESMRTGSRGAAAAPLWALSPDPTLGNESPRDVPPRVSPVGRRKADPFPRSAVREGHDPGRRTKALRGRGSRGSRPGPWRGVWPHTLAVQGRLRQPPGPNSETKGHRTKKQAHWLKIPVEVPFL